MKEPRRNRGRRRRIATALVAAALTLLLASAAVDLLLRVGPTRPADFHGKRVARGEGPTGQTYRVSYSYDAAGRQPSDTDRVSYSFYMASHYGSPLRVRTFGVGTFRFARLAGGADPAADRLVVMRWGIVAVFIASLGATRVIRRRANIT